MSLCNPMDCSPPGSSVHGILQARVLQWVAMPFSRGSSQPQGIARMSLALTGGFFTTNATREVHLLQYQDFSQQGFPSPPAAIHLCLPGQRPCLQTPQGCSSNSASGLLCASRTANPPPKHPCPAHLAVTPSTAEVHPFP